MYISALGCNSVKQNIFRKNNNNLNNYPKQNNNITSDTFCRSKASKIAFQAAEIKFDPKLCELIIPSNDLLPIKKAYKSLESVLQEVKVESTDGLKLTSWFLPPKEKKPVIYLLGGTGWNRTYWQSVLHKFNNDGIGAFAIDYRGFGGNFGKATELGLKQDALAGFNTLTKKMGYDDNNVAIWGHSMGGALALKTLRSLEKHENRTVSGIIDSTFTNGNLIKKHFLDSKLGEIEKVPQKKIDELLKELETPAGHIEFNNLKIVPKLHSKIIFMHNNGDKYIPAEMSFKLYRDSKNGNAQIYIEPSTKESLSVHLNRSWAIDPIKKFMGIASE